MLTAPNAVAALAALAQEHRLGVFRLLVQAGETGLSAGAIAEQMAIPPSSLSFHLAHLTRADMVQQQRHGRMQIYRANYSAMRALIGYLGENCCGGAVRGAAVALSQAPGKDAACATASSGGRA